jgi:hypothetical protein
LLRGWLENSSRPAIARELADTELEKAGCNVRDMFSNTNAVSSSTDCSSPAVLSDADLLLATRRLVGRSNQLLAALLAHLAEVETRGIHRTRACSSLYVYCIYELRLSEDEAYRRVTAARLVRRFPALLEAIGAGELHLTGLLMLGPHLTAEIWLRYWPAPNTGPRRKSRGSSACSTLCRMSRQGLSRSVPRRRD